jgi:Asp-tRNA(Asn)/Glu-tRNA(Gln) amidotransferase A subunit family amidase
LSAPALPATHSTFDELTIGKVAAGTPRYAWYPYTHPFNVTGHPAMSVPVGWCREELPIGLQIVGPWHAEDGVISVGRETPKARPSRCPARASAKSPRSLNLPGAFLFWVLARMN